MAFRAALILLVIGFACATDLVLDLTAEPKSVWPDGCGDGGSFAADGYTCNQPVNQEDGSGDDHGGPQLNFAKASFLAFRVTGVTGGTNGAAATYTVESKSSPGGSFTADMSTIDNLVLNFNAPSGNSFQVDATKATYLLGYIVMAQPMTCPATEYAPDFSQATVKLDGASAPFSVDESVALGDLWSGKPDHSSNFGNQTVILLVQYKKASGTTGTIAKKTVTFTIKLDKSKACTGVKEFHWASSQIRLGAGGTDYPLTIVSDGSSSGTSSASSVAFALVTLLAMMIAAMANL